MQQHHGAAVRLLRPRDVHIGHAQLLAVIDDGQQADRIGIGEAFEIDAIGLARRVGGVAGTRQARGGR